MISDGSSTQDRLIASDNYCCAICWHVSECEQQHNRMFDVIQPIFCALTHQFDEWCRHAIVGQNTERAVAPQFFDRVPHYLFADVLSCLYLMQSHLSTEFCRCTFSNLNDKSVSFLKNSGFTPRAARMLAGESSRACINKFQSPFCSIRLEIVPTTSRCRCLEAFSRSFRMTDCH